jgi:hypothetical protein
MEDIPHSYSSESNASTPPLKFPSFPALRDDPLPSIAHLDPIDQHNLADLPLSPMLAEMSFHTPGDNTITPVHMPFPVQKAEGWYFPELLSPELDLPKPSNPLDQIYFNQADTNHTRETLNIPNTDSIIPGNLSPDQTPSIQVRDLSSILVAMTNYTSDLHRYRTGNIDTKHSSSIYDYTIGGATYLAQWLREIISRQKWTRTEFPSLNSGIDDSVDTPTLLMMLPCYMSLVNIYDIVFYDLRQLLAILPDSTLSSSSAGLRWDVRLGDLPLTNDGFVLSMPCRYCWIRWMRLKMILVCDLHFCHVLLVIDRCVEHVQSSNDSIIESLFKKNVSAGAAMEGGLSGGLRAKVVELRGLLKQNLNV